MRWGREDVDCNLPWQVSAAGLRWQPPDLRTRPSSPVRLLRGHLSWAEECAGKEQVRQEVGRWGERSRDHGVSPFVVRKVELQEVLRKGVE